MEEKEFAEIISIITQQTGIVPRESHKVGIMNFIEKRKKEIDLGELPYSVFLRLNKDELCLLLNASTVNETYFFREESQFALLKDKILPEFRTKLGTKPIRIWSAASSSGEEIYSLFLLAQSLGLKTECVASDINTAVLEKCSKGAYTPNSVKLVDGAKFHHLLGKYLKSDRSVLFPEEICKQIELRQINLSLVAESFPRGVHLIFIRNVFIYFTSEMKKQILSKIVNESLTDGGYLFVSMSELPSIDASILPKNLKKCCDGKVFYFKKEG